MYTMPRHNTLHELWRHALIQWKHKKLIFFTIKHQGPVQDLSPFHLCDEVMYQDAQNATDNMTLHNCKLT